MKKKPTGLIRPDDTPPQVRRSRRPKKSASIQPIIEHLETLDAMVVRLLAMLREHQQQGV